MPVRHKMRDVNDILRNEPKVDLESDQEEYPELELNEEVEAVTSVDNQASTEVLTSKITLLEGMWQMERWLNNQLEISLGKVEEERNQLKMQLSTRQQNNKRKRNETEGNKSKEVENKKKRESCKTCGKGHIGECLKGKNICYNCGQGGHHANKCLTPKKGECFNCGAHDHQVKNCPKKEARKLGANQVVV